MEQRDSDIHDLTGVYVLDALADIERDSFEKHLPGCPPCLAEVSMLRTAVLRLAVLASSAPPPVLWKRISADLGYDPDRTIRPNGRLELDQFGPISIIEGVVGTAQWSSGSIVAATPEVSRETSAKGQDGTLRPLDGSISTDIRHVPPADRAW